MVNQIKVLVNNKKEAIATVNKWLAYTGKKDENEDVTIESLVEEGMTYPFTLHLHEKRTKDGWDLWTWSLGRQYYDLITYNDFMKKYSTNKRGLKQLNLENVLVEDRKSVDDFWETAVEAKNINQIDEIEKIWTKYIKPTTGVENMKNLRDIIKGYPFPMVIYLAFAEKIKYYSHPWAHDNGAHAKAQRFNVLSFEKLRNMYGNRPITKHLKQLKFESNDLEAQNLIEQFNSLMEAKVTTSLLDNYYETVVKVANKKEANYVQDAWEKHIGKITPRRITGMFSNDKFDYPAYVYLVQKKALTYDNQQTWARDKNDTYARGNNFTPLTFSEFKRIYGKTESKFRKDLMFEEFLEEKNINELVGKKNVVEIKNEKEFDYLINAVKSHLTFNSRSGRSEGMARKELRDGGVLYVSLLGSTVAEESEPGDSLNYIPLESPRSGRYYADKGYRVLKFNEFKEYVKKNTHLKQLHLESLNEDVEPGQKLFDDDILKRAKTYGFAREFKGTEEELERFKQELTDLGVRWRGGSSLFKMHNTREYFKRFVLNYDGEGYLVASRGWRSEGEKPYNTKNEKEFFELLKYFKEEEE